MISRITITPKSTFIESRHHNLSPTSTGHLPKPIQRERDRKAVEMLRARADELEAGSLRSASVRTNARTMLGEELVKA